MTEGEPRKARWKRFADGLDRLVDALHHLGFGEGIVLVSSALLYGFNAWRFEMPVGYAGLYSLMTEQIVASGYRLPFEVPYYGPGGIPFAYPPLGLYLGALFTGILHVPLLTYLRILPPAYGLLTVVAVYFLATRFLSSRPKALLSAALFGTLSLEVSYHGMASGMVRGPAMIMLLVGLGLAWDALRAKRCSFLRLLGTAVLLGLTAMCHLSYAAIFVLSLLAMGLGGSGSQRRTALPRAGVIAVIGGLIAAPWVLTIVRRYGLGTFAGALASHGNLGVLRGALVDWRMIPSHFWWLISGIGQDWEAGPLVGMLLVGLMYACMRGRWLMPAWFLAVLLLTGEPDRFLLLLACLLVADAVVDIAAWLWSAAGDRRGSLVWSFVVPVCLIWGWCFLTGFRSVKAETPLLSPEAIAMGQWMQASTPEASTFLFTYERKDLMEWMPFLARRTPVAMAWGAEWLGTYDVQSARLGKLLDCGQSAACLTDNLWEMGLSPDYIITTSDRSKLITGLSGDPSWQQVYKNPGYLVFGRRVQSAGT